MRKAFPIGLLALLAIIVTACQKEISSETGGNAGVTGTLKMKIDGTAWVADVTAGAYIMNGLINISGVSKDKKMFTITLLGDTTGTYIIDPVDMEGVAALSDSMENPLAYASNQGDITNAGGTVTVTKIDQTAKTISGTFQIKIYREIDGKQKVLTEGVFENLSYATTLPPGSATDTFKVKIDGVDWKPDNVTGAKLTFPISKISIVANNATATKTVMLTMPGDITPGNYTLDVLGFTYIGQYNPTQSLFLSSETGTLTILEHNVTTKRIRGNFEFKATELVPSTPPKIANITNGYFSVVYQ